MNCEIFNLFIKIIPMAMTAGAALNFCSAVKKNTVNCAGLVREIFNLFNKIILMSKTARSGR